MRIRTVLGGIATGLALTGIIAIGEPVYANPAAGTSCGTTADNATVPADGGTLTCENKTWVFHATTQANTQNGGGQQCNMEMLGKKINNGTQVCIQIAGNFTVIAAPAGCTGEICGQVPAEIPGTCAEGAKQQVTYAPGKTAECTCTRKAAGTVLVPVKAAAASGDSLPVTGADAGTIAVAGGIAVLMGALAVGLWAVRRRRVSFTA